MERQSKKRRFGLVVSCVALLAVTVAGVAAQGKKASLDDLLAAIGLLSAKVDVITIQSSVWEQACIGVSVQCTTTHNTDPASSANHNPVAIRFQVLRNGKPVLGLTSARVTLDHGSTPANGPGLQRCDESASCAPDLDSNFQDSGNGLYVLWVHPHEESESLWKAGSYMMTLRVLDPLDELEGYGMAEIEIVQ
jgi:hypothetical protein